MQVLGSRRGGWATLALVVVAAVAAVAFAVWQLAERPSVDDPLPGPGSAVPDRRPRIAFEVPGGARLGDLRVTLDGRDVTADLRGRDGRVEFTPPARLAEGSHAVAVRFSSGNLFARTVRRAWSFDVDTRPPALAVAAPERGGLVARRAVRFAGRAEAGARVSVGFPGGEAAAAAGEDGRWRLVARLPEGRVATTVTATDAAGNTTERRRRVTVDTTAPDLALAAPAAGEQITATDEPVLTGSVASDDPSLLTYTASVNGAVVARVTGREAVTPEEIAAGYGEVSGTTPALEIDGARFAMPVGTLAQGRNAITVTVRDRAGNRARATRVVHVDSTEEFGAADLGRRARGDDVVELQRRLREAKVYPKRAKLTGVIDAVTAKSISRYQKRYGLPRTGVADERTRRAMVGRIVVNLTQRKLRLIRHGTVVKTYRIAVGQPAHPTPTGDYEINDKQVDPTWYPPDSPWAAELSTIPPGPGNPLGTRWIGTTAPAIGIHGTYADSSIGTAASHGCMRMHIPDVEELYEMVTLGMRVSIRP
ncbi:L,D-transpeptidase family protein [Miltoncostaea marina]|uniref:L,D-transpeptidase family protein n=1 Tax=Miltoncostaea marina TaxID=2843215 RepID=UPI001C3DBCB7|nr:L,D-transpeptidase family protein [Miltoncostaea marina]